MNKLLVICGPTATGKTSLAFGLAEKCDGELVSADSRQVYKGMDIGTGKDLPVNAKFKYQNTKLGGYYEIGEERVWGYDLVGPTESFNVADYIKASRAIIENIWERGKLPILVGGTGLYIKGVVDGIGTSGIGKDDKLRRKLSGKSPKELYDLLTRFDLVRARSLNESDRNNPRRLIRAIEIAKSKSKKKDRNMAVRIKADTLFIGLKASKETIDKRIVKRVKERLEEGFLDEVKSLEKEGVDWSNPSMSATGYRHIEGYYKGEETKSEFMRNWRKSEVQYAKRQMTWFRKEKRIHWFDISNRDYRKTIEKYVQEWYFKSKHVS
ncbi:tRNA (adenosine(37)-N6)-dimethylallyltransferase MiaA [Candidatus Woesebacteria bacterium]|nr:tRNA (adenosine(37)-N6)-dimethylallyltransferase MiaA [Candidatus Woesebacteria bacterium]